MAISLAKTALLFLLCATTTGAQAPSSPPSLTDADEIRLGQAIADDFVAQEGMQPSPQTRKIDDYLQSVGDRVTARARRKIPYRFHFDPSPSFRSAVGLPGGQIFVGAGILAYMDSEDQLAMVLGHEVEHIDLNQCRDRLTKFLSDQHLTVSMADTLKVDPFLPGYGREGELAADREGVLLAMQAGYSVEAAIRLLQTYIILGEQMPNTPKESKENLERRIAQIRAVNAESKLPKPAAEKPLSLP